MGARIPEAIGLWSGFAVDATGEVMRRAVDPLPPVRKMDVPIEDGLSTVISYQFLRDLFHHHRQP